MTVAAASRTRTRAREWLAIVVALGGLVACAAPPVPSASTRPLGPGEQWLPTVPPGLCAGGGATTEIRLHGSSSDPRIAWLEMPDGSRRQVSWLPGTSARFTPDLEVIGPDGRIVAREGALITGTCTIGPDALVAEFGPAPSTATGAG